MNPKALFLMFVCLILSAPVLAVQPDEILDDPVLEERAREIGRELRCITCQSQSIDDSDAPLAKDLRIIVRERLVEGDTNEDVIAFVTDRYGDYVRLRPAMRIDTMLLWAAPAIALLLGLAAAFFFFRSMAAKTDGLSPEPIDGDID